MARVVRALEDYAATLADRVTPHPLWGAATLSVGLVSGGVSVNTVPDECLIEVDRRVIPGENGAEVIDDVRDHLEQNVDVPFEFLPPWLVGIPLPDEGNGDWAGGCRITSPASPVPGNWSASPTAPTPRGSPPREFLESSAAPVRSSRHTPGTSGWRWPSWNRPPRSITGSAPRGLM
ncbi:MAG: hypothetical protein Ct9H300mP1_32400 [Planctomycetaceae bacterium]|nr:MAG: hypothetical protein Ct9H300mP1_32400 [Planctomycetaceae bacterium]